MIEMTTSAKRESAPQLAQHASQSRSVKLLVVSMLYEPDFVGIAAVASDLCAGLAKRGHDVTVYTTYPYYPEWERKSNDNPWRIRQEESEGVKIWRHGLFIPAHPSKLLPRIVHELSFPLSLTRSMFRRQQFDVVMAFCPLLGSLAFATLRKMVRGKPLWVNIQDMPAEAGRATGINRSKTFHFLGSTVQRTLFRKAEIWSTISPEMVSQLETVKSKRNHLYLCPNWLTRSLANRVAQLPSKVGRHPRRPLELLYSGTIGKKQSLVQFCQALHATDLDFRFRIRGDGSEASSVRNWVANSGDARFDIGGLLPEQEFVQAVHDADWFVITEMHRAGASFLPSKLMPCVSAGTPVLAIADHDGPLGCEMAASKIGVCVEWKDLENLSVELMKFSAAPGQFTALQENCLQHAQAYDRDLAIERVERILLAHSQPNGKQHNVDI
ncbi:MAG: glycosyltransferase [Planctomycetales bacterium]|nr:glycosyltransferase [Planctomycetales bacterium]